MRAILAVAVCVAALSAGVSARATTYNTSDEALVVQLVNQTRAGVGVPPLRPDPGLQSMARAQAVRMAARGDIFHNPNLVSDITALGVNWQMVGENVGMGPDVNAVYKALLASPHHYENITRSNYTSIGVGEVTGSAGVIYLVQVFAQISPVASKPVSARAPVVTAPAPVRTAPPARTATPRPVLTPAPRRPEPNALLGGVVFTAGLPAAPRS
jgi:hypothetical protein